MAQVQDKARAWLAALAQGVGSLDTRAQAAVMARPGRLCGRELQDLFERRLGRAPAGVEELVEAWNGLRRERGLGGGFELKGRVVEAAFAECGCPLVRSGITELSPAHCLCGRAMIEAVFSRAAGRPVGVEQKQAIGRGDDACRLVIRLGK